MKKNLKAALLSAFVLPGLGQLYKGDSLKGGILVALVNVFLLGALFVVLQGAGKLLPLLLAPEGASPARLLDGLQRQSPAARWLLGGFSLLWAYGVVDALLARRKDAES